MAVFTPSPSLVVATAESLSVVRDVVEAVCVVATEAEIVSDISVVVSRAVYCTAVVSEKKELCPHIWRINLMKTLLDTYGPKITGFVP